MLQRGDTLDRYRIDGLLGEGGMGHVYAAYDAKLRRRVALKVWRSDKAASKDRKEILARMVHEACATAALTHPNVVSMFDYGVVDDVPFIAMELVEGQRLRERIGDESVPTARKIGWLLGIARALRSAHARGLVHRDIKPENVMVCADDAVKVLDFGIARRQFEIPDAVATTSEGPRSRHTLGGAGTPQYMAPEHILGRPADALSDQFAWGLLAYELLTGRYPWGPAMEPFALSDRPPKPLGELVPDAPLDLQRAVARAMEIDTGKRCASMDEVVRALESSINVPSEQVSGPALLRDGVLPLQRGEVFAGKYRVERVMARGGFGVVLEATHMALEQRVAVKFLNPELADKPDLVARFSREAKAAARLQNVHIVRVLDVATLDNGAPYMVMEYLEGQDLEAFARANGPLPYKDALRYLLQACEALAEAHAMGVVHRDLKLANLHLSRARDGRTLLKVLDFGISKIDFSSDDRPLESPVETRMTKATQLIGSPAFMSPEQLRDPRTVDARSDVWSLGVVLYETVTGVSPFMAGSLAEICARVFTYDPPPPSSLLAGIPTTLDAVVARCIAREPAARFASMKDLAEALRGVLDGSAPRPPDAQSSSPAVAPAPVFPSEPRLNHSDVLASAITHSPARRFQARGRERIVAVAGMLGVLGVAVAVVLAYGRWKHAPVPAPSAAVAQSSVSAVPTAPPPDPSAPERLATAPASPAASSAAPDTTPQTAPSAQPQRPTPTDRRSGGRRRSQPATVDTAGFGGWDGPGGK